MALSREDWIEAAWEALLEGGPARVAVNSLATELGATRGSFYWHFSDRGELLVAALEEWERRLTDETIAAVEAEPDPALRAGQLIELVMTDARAPLVDVALAAHAADPIVGPVLARVTARRIAFVEQCFRDLGFGEAARPRAVIAYSAFVGWLQLRHIAPEAVPADGVAEVTAAASEIVARWLAPVAD